MHTFEAKKVTRYFVSIEIDSMVNRCDEEGVFVNEGKVTVKKSFGTKLSAQRWVAKMTTLNEDGFFKMSEVEKKQYKEQNDIKDFLARVNKISQKMFGRSVYYIHREIDTDCCGYDMLLNRSIGFCDSFET